MGCAASTECVQLSARDVAKPQRFFEKYSLAERLGEGSFSEVRAVRRGVPGDRSTAVKILSLHGAGGVSSAERLERAREEYSLWRSLAAHPNVVQVLGFFLERQGPGDATAYLLMERCDEPLGRRLNLFSATGALGFPLSNLREVFRGMLSAISHVHAYNVVHRDVTVDHFLMASGHATEVKLCDFGMATVLPRCGYLQDSAGTSPYLSPEAIGGQRYGLAADVWACGVCVYNVLYDDFPHTVTLEHASIKDAICSGRSPAFAPTRRSMAPAPLVAVELAQALLNADAGLRPTAHAALQLRLFQQLPRGSTLQTLDARLPGPAHRDPRPSFGSSKSVDASEAISM